MIGVDGSRLGTPKRTGTENYSSEITRHLLRLDLPVRWRLYLNAGAGSDMNRDWSLRAETRPIPAPRLWTHARLSAEMVHRPPDVLFVPSHVVPLLHPESVVTIHDLGYLRYPETHPPAQRRMLDLTTRWSARVSRHIIVPSHATKDDLVQAYDLDERKITVIHHGVSDRFRSVPASAVQELRTRLALPARYVLTVGTLQPRKNVETLARAVAMVNSQGTDCTLVAAGKRGWLADEVLERLTALALGDRLRLLDYIDDGDLPALYAGASCYVQPSLYEGFGLPVVEAMSAAVPVLVSNASSLPEIAGSGADVFDPGDADALGNALQAVLSSPERAKEMAERARRRSSHFSWQRAAEDTATVLLDQLRQSVTGC